MVDVTQAKTTRNPPANEIVPKKKVDEWDALLLTVKGDLTAIDKSLDTVQTKITEVVDSISSLRSVVLVLGIINIILSAIIVGMMVF